MVSPNAVCLALTVVLLAMAGASPTTAAAPRGIALVPDSRSMVRVRPWMDFRRDRTATQTRDHTCGLAAVATLLRFELDDASASEAAMLELVARGLSRTELEEQREIGISLDVLARAVRALGYIAEPAELSVAAIERLPAPVVILLQNRSQHYMVLRSARDGVADLADPRFGNRTMPVAELTRVWKGRALLIDTPDHKLMRSHAIPARELEDCPSGTGVKD